MGKNVLFFLGKDLIVTAVLAVIALVALMAAGWVTLNPSSVPQGFDAGEIAVLKERDIIDFIVTGNGPDALVTYAYRGEPLPEKLATDEIVEKRTESSYTRFLGPKTTGSRELLFETISYARKTFIERDGKWYYIEHDTVSKDHFDAALNPLSFFIVVAHAATETIYSGVGDGYVYYTGTAACAADWNTVHDAATGVDGYGGTPFDYTSTTAPVASESVTGEVPACMIRRAFLPFDTSSIPAGSIISSATLNVYVTAKTNSDNDGTDYITVVQTSQAAHSSLADVDYDQCGSINSPTEGVDSGERKDITSISVSAYTTFTLNATGQGWIKKSGEDAPCSTTNGITCLGIREGHDTADSPITDDTINQISFSTSEHSGTTQDPYLSVTYTPPFSFWQFQDY